MTIFKVIDSGYKVLVPCLNMSLLTIACALSHFPFLGVADDGFVMPVSALIPSLHLFVKPLDLVFESLEYL